MSRWSAPANVEVRLAGVAPEACAEHTRKRIANNVHLIRPRMAMHQRMQMVDVFFLAIEKNEAFGMLY
ncbi:hypothetical protein HBI81_064010 [Parastagonospora nodorum]|nr:hypothetical protein HBI09_078900 [Parastagonospora nodorum]KAH4286132.1 hypothetical protein HBI01_241430 [Parastagonospora nodorum]KAH4291401.1 hypothetical protein HBI02_194510 [Parastagonospora nodorum]KAH4736346.1 hypothetical protein HBH64_242000 [Parastagonospora nodorum]KAH5243617.1 hypothetical protein HBI70_239590 [Parastagonospora nodorum]